MEGEEEERGESTERGREREEIEGPSNKFLEESNRKHEEAQGRTRE